MPQIPRFFRVSRPSSRSFETASQKAAEALKLADKGVQRTEIAEHLTIGVGL